MIEKKVLSHTLDQFAKAIVLPFFQKRMTPISICFLMNSAISIKLRLILVVLYHSILIFLYD